MLHVFNDPVGGVNKDKAEKPSTSSNKKPSSTSSKKPTSSTSSWAAQKQAQLEAQKAAYQNYYNSTAAQLLQYRDQQLAAAQGWYDDGLARLQQILNEQLAFEQNAYNQMLAAQQAAYDRNVAGANAYYAGMYQQAEGNYQNQIAAAGQDYQRALALLQQNHDAGKQQVNDVTKDSLQQAYIEKMMAEKNIGQQLSAMGKSGGASESTLLAMSNQYGSSRNALETERLQQLAALAQQLSEQKAERTAGYEQQKREYQDAYTGLVNGYRQQQAAQLAQFEQDKNQYIADWSADSLLRQQGYRSDYSSELTALAKELAQQQMQAEQFYQQSLFGAQSELQKQLAALMGW